MKKIKISTLFVFFLIIPILYSSHSFAQAEEVKACHPILPNQGGCNDGTNPCIKYACEANPDEGIDGQPSFVCVEKDILSTEDANLDPGFCGEDDPEGLSCSRPSCDLEGNVICHAYVADQDGDGVIGEQCGGTDCDDTLATVFEECPEAPEFCGNGIVEGVEECEVGDDFCNATCTYNRGIGEPCDESLLVDYDCALIGGEYLCSRPVDFNSIECEVDFPRELPGEVEGCGDGFVDRSEECEIGDYKCNDSCEFNRGVGEPCNENIPSLFDCELSNEEWICAIPVNFDEIECIDDDLINRGGVGDDDGVQLGMAIEDDVQEGLLPEVNEELEEEPLDPEIAEFVEEEEIEVVQEDSNNVQCLSSGNEKWVPVSLDQARDMMGKGMTMDYNGGEVEIRYNQTTGMIEQRFGCVTIEKKPQFQFTGSSCQLSIGDHAVNRVQLSMYFMAMIGLLSFFGVFRKKIN